MHRNDKWNQLLSKLKPGDKSFWKISRNLRGKHNSNIPYFIEGSRKIVADYEKAQKLLKCFSESHNLTSNFKHSIDKTVNRKVKSFKSTNMEHDNIEFTTIEELNYYITSLKSTKSPGLDEVSNNLIKNLPQQAVKLLANIFNSCLKLNYFPTQFKRTKVVAILKPNKPKHCPKSYRPISLLSNLGKLFEKIILNRLNDSIGNLSLIAKEQFGFKKGHSAVHQINRITNIIQNNKRRK